MNNGLRGFSKEARRAIQEAQERGWRLTVSSNGHAILHHPEGATTVVGHDPSPRNMQNTMAALRRGERERETEMQTVNTAMVEYGDGEEVMKWVCDTCGKDFPAQRQLNGHKNAHVVNRKKRRRRLAPVEEPVAEVVEPTQPDAATPEPPTPTTAPTGSDGSDALRSAVQSLIPALEATLVEIDRLKAENARLTARLERLALLALED